MNHRIAEYFPLNFLGAPFVPGIGRLTTPVKVLVAMVLDVLTCVACLGSGRGMIGGDGDVLGVLAGVCGV